MFGQSAATLPPAQAAIPLSKDYRACVTPDWITPMLPEQFERVPFSQ